MDKEERVIEVINQKSKFSDKISIAKSSDCNGLTNKKKDSYSKGNSSRELRVAFSDAGHKDPSVKKKQNTAEEEHQALIDELVEMGFDDKLIKSVLKFTTNKEEAINLILSGEGFVHEEEEKQNEPTSLYSKMVIVVRTDLKMGRGKIAAQVGHGVLGAYKIAISKDPVSIGIWEESGQAKIIVKADNEFQLREIYNESLKREMPVCQIEDAGRTQIEAGTVTVCAVGPGPEGIIDKSTGHLKLL